MVVFHCAHQPCNLSLSSQPQSTSSSTITPSMCDTRGYSSFSQEAWVDLVVVYPNQIPPLLWLSCQVPFMVPYTLDSSIKRPSFVVLIASLS